MENIFSAQDSTAMTKSLPDYYPIWRSLRLYCVSSLYFLIRIYDKT